MFLYWCLSVYNRRCKSCLGPLEIISLWVLSPYEGQNPLKLKAKKPVLFCLSKQDVLGNKVLPSASGEQFPTKASPDLLDMGSACEERRKDVPRCHFKSRVVSCGLASLILLAQSPKPDVTRVVYRCIPDRKRHASCKGGSLLRTGSTSVLRLLFWSCLVHSDGSQGVVLCRSKSQNLSWALKSLHKQYVLSINPEHCCVAWESEIKRSWRVSDDKLVCPDDHKISKREDKEHTEARASPVDE